MIDSSNLGGMMGAPIVGPEDEKIGHVAQVFVDPDHGQPNWVTVHTGLFGGHESFVPLTDATWDNEVLHVSVTKHQVKDAPRIDTDGALDARQEGDLYSYYGLETTGQPLRKYDEPPAQKDGAAQPAEPVQRSEPATQESNPSDANSPEAEPERPLLEPEPENDVRPSEDAASSADAGPSADTAANNHQKGRHRA